jgi:hypothetical protein
LEFRDNVITENAGDALLLFLTGRHELGGNTLTGNAAGHDIVRLTRKAETVQPRASLTLPNFGVPYVVTAPSGISRASGTRPTGPAWSAGRSTRGSALANPTLTIEPGTTVLFEPGEAFGIGYAGWDYVTLVADGTAGTIIFDGVVPEPGGWAGIDFGPATQLVGESRLIHCRIAHGGSPRPRGAGGNVLISGNAPIIRDCDIRDSASWGIWLYDVSVAEPDSLEAANRFEGNAAGKVRRP